jgi:hypothetical protein
MANESWKKSSPELQERFGATVAQIPDLEPRQMFGYRAAFIGGNLTTSLHRESWIVRLPPEVIEQRLADGWAAFEPMHGRPMRGYVAMPADIGADPDLARPWVERAAAFVRTLPPKRR